MKVRDYMNINLTNLIRVLKATTVEDVSFKRYNDYLQLKGNGTYKLHIQLDENGNEFKLPITIPARSNKNNAQLFFPATPLLIRFTSF